MKKVLIYFFICFILGIMSTFLFEVQLMQKILNGFKSIPFWMYFILFILSFYLTLTAHELGHLFSFKIQGIKIRALYITMFVFYRSEKGLRFTIKPKMMKLLGGMVFPNLDVIKTEEQYNSLRMKFSKALIDGPIATIIYLIIYMSIFFFVWIFSSNVTLIGYLLVINIFTILFSFLYIVVSKISNEMFYGDFKAYEKMKDDEVFSFVQIVQYLEFSLYDHKNSNHFLAKKSEELLLKSKINYNVFYLSLLNIYLTYYYEGEITYNNEINTIINNINIRRLLNKKDYYQIVLLISKYYYLNDELDKAYELVNKLLKVIIDVEEEKYLYNYTLHIFHLEDNKDYLSNNNKKEDPLHFIFDILIKNEKEEVKKLPHKTYETIIYCPLNGSLDEVK